MLLSTTSNVQDSPMKRHISLALLAAVFALTAIGLCRPQRARPCRTVTASKAANGAIPATANFRATSSAWRPPAERMPIAGSTQGEPTAHSVAAVIEPATKRPG